MSEEARFFLRISLYTGLITAVYWFVSYEWSGTVMLAFLFGSAVFFVSIVSLLVRTANAPVERNAPAPRRLAGALKAVVGFEDDPAVEPQAPLEIEEDRFPTASIWPLVLSVGVLLVGLGLVYGAWLWIPGAGLLVASGLGWATQLSA
ncbi:MAG: hypothetical protein ACRDLB_14335 [Actinomycetota bacterium]